MSWRKQGVIYKPDGGHSLYRSHAAIPFGDVLDNDILRIYLSSRNAKGLSIPYYIEVDTSNFNNVKKISDPILELGPLGTFDDSGIMPSCLVNVDGIKYLYYIGWNPQVTVSYRLSIGLAISKDGGITFEKYSLGPICDRSIDEPYFNTAPFVIHENGLWKMWYISTTKWELINDYPEPHYHVKYATSKDGVLWDRSGKICIDYDSDAQAIGRPSVIKEDGIYKMYYSYRKVENYRINKLNAYRLGYAESTDGLNWLRKDHKIEIHQSENPQEWDYEMIEYCHVFKMNNKKVMLYNGNGFGKTGIGYAIRE